MHWHWARLLLCRRVRETAASSPRQSTSGSPRAAEPNTVRQFHRPSRWTERCLAVTRHSRGVLGTPAVALWPPVQTQPSAGPQRALRSSSSTPPRPPSRRALLRPGPLEGRPCETPTPCYAAGCPTPRSNGGRGAQARSPRACGAGRSHPRTMFRSPPRAGFRGTHIAPSPHPRIDPDAQSTHIQYYRQAIPRASTLASARLPLVLGPSPRRLRA